MNLIRHPSPNFGARADGKKANLLILHYTETLTTEQALHILQNAERQVSAHYLVGDNGDVIAMVDEDKRAWHAGKSFWKGETDVNSTSIGIEIQNPGHSYGYVPFPDVQMVAVKELCLEIMDRHHITPAGVLAHSDIAPERKIDPGELFPWEDFAKSQIGLWPRAGVAEMDRAEDILPLLTAYGYDPSISPRILVTAFQRHFQPEIFATPEKVGIPTAETIRILKDLLKQKSALT